MGFKEAYRGKTTYMYACVFGDRNQSDERAYLVAVASTICMRLLI
jgi:hypothetical protein